MIPARCRVVFAAGILLLSACPAAPAPLTATVTRVLDGDTVETATGETIRLLGVDAPELSEECWGEEAFTQTRALLLDRTVEVEHDLVREDAFGRTLAYLYLDGGLIQEFLLTHGHACLLVIAPNDRYANYLEAVEQSARISGAGLWRTCGGCDTSL